MDVGAGAEVVVVVAGSGDRAQCCCWSCGLDGYMMELGLVKMRFGGDRSVAVGYTYTDARQSPGGCSSNGA